MKKDALKKAAKALNFGQNEHQGTYSDGDVESSPRQMGGRLI
jgi:hypothetical protein